MHKKYVSKGKSDKVKVKVKVSNLAIKGLNLNLLGFCFQKARSIYRGRNNSSSFGLIWRGMDYKKVMGREGYE